MGQNDSENDAKWWRKTTKPLKFIIVGAGVAGLAAAIGLHKVGHQVTIFEQSHKISEVGAGIQMPPNAARILARLGLFDRLLEKSTILSSLSTRRYANDEELTSISLKPQMSEKYGWPLSFIHRGDLQRIMLELIYESGVDVVIGQRVVRVDDQFAARVQLASGEWLSGDVVIAADGIKSQIRAQMAAAQGTIDRSSPTGDAAYRLLIPRQRVLQDPQSLKIFDGDVGIRWIGPGGHIMAYPISPMRDEKSGKVQKTLLNMVLLHRQRSHTPNDESWTNKGSKTEMLDYYQSWAPIIQNLLSHVPEGEVVEWTLNTHDPLTSWTEGSVALMGDACHPQLPYVAQGAAQCLEDAGVLSECFSRTSDVQVGLAVYELVRKDRAEKIQSSTVDTRAIIHLPDGPAQRARDEKMKGLGGGAHRDKLVDHKWQDFMYAVDVMKDTRERWNEVAREVRAKL